MSDDTLAEDVVPSDTALSGSGVASKPAVATLASTESLVKLPDGWVSKRLGAERFPITYGNALESNMQPASAHSFIGSIRFFDA